jgi:hypothetical protein
MDHLTDAVLDELIRDTPPSRDRPEQTPPKIEKPSTGKKRGGHAGHVKRERELIPTERCDKAENHVPRSCDSIGSRLAGCGQNPRRHQASEIPQIKPTTKNTEFTRCRIPAVEKQRQRNFPSEHHQGDLGRM